MRTTRLKTACRVALVATFLLAGAPALGQAPSDGVLAEGVPKAERIEVTGSRIASTDVESASPIAVIEAEAIKAEGYQSLELILNNYPQFVADQGDRVSNGATGTATADLRYLFPERTLVLLNGRRLPAGSPYLLAPDLNQIPVHLVSRVEILTGGASAVYGSDAMAGVVNIILNERFEGVQGEIWHGFYNHRQKNDFMQGLLRQANIEIPGNKSHDGAKTAVMFTLGGNFAGGKGNATASFRYQESEALPQSERDYSACALTIVNFRMPGAYLACGGVVTGYPGRFVDVATRSQWTVADANGGVRPWNNPGDLFNYGPWNYYQRSGERYGFNAFANYDVLDAARVYAEFGFHDDHTLSQLAPSGLFGGITQIRWENPLLSDDWRSRLSFTRPDGTPGSGPGTSAQMVIQRRNAEGGGRQADIRHSSHRNVIGMKGAFAKGWDYDIWAQYAKVVLAETYLRDFSITRTARALDVVTDPGTGSPVCASVLNGTDSACVPWDIWRLEGVSPEALAYLETPGLRSGSTTQKLFSTIIRGDLDRYGLRTPWAKAAAEVAFGYERRTDKMDLVTDAAFSSGDLAGQGQSSPSAGGKVSVDELFAEARLPVLDSLLLSGSFRRSDYSTGRKADTYGLGFNASPVEAVRFRGSYQRAIRAANIVDLFTPQIEGFYGIVGGDPCAGPVPARSLAECERTGVTAQQYGRIDDVPPGVGYPALYGGNPDLAPETGTTVTVGLAITPTRNLAATFDYFDIEVDDFIHPGTPGVTLTRCLDTGDPTFCGLITRDPALGTLWLPPARILANDQNIGSVRTSGVDVDLSYRYGNLLFSGIGTYVRTFEWEPYRGAEAHQCAGVFFDFCGKPLPKWRHRLTASWDTPWNLRLSATWRYFHSVRDRHPDAVVKELDAMNYLDLALSWAVDKRMTLRAGVNNVTDRDPPLIAGGTITANGNTWVQAYDALGRHVYMSLTARF